LSYRLDIVLLKGIDAAFSLNQLHHDGAHIVPALSKETIHVIGVGIAEALGKGEEKFMEVILAGSLQSGDGAAMEGILQGNNGSAALAVLVIGVLAGSLDHALICLGAGVAKEGRRHTGGGNQLGGQNGIGFGIEKVGD